MKASVLITNYNYEKYIAACLESLRLQTFKDFEIIFFDDNSTDNSILEVKKFNNIKLIENKIRSDFGSLNQMNGYKQAFDMSNGKYIFTLDSDDFYDPKKIEKVINEFDKSNSNIIFDMPTVFTNEKKYKMTKRNNFLNLKRFKFFPQQSCLAFKREIFNDMYNKILIDNYPNVWFDFRVANYADYILGGYKIYNSYLTFYRNTDKNISSKFKKYSRHWWSRRLEYHKYVNEFLEKNNLMYNKYNFDYILTNVFNKILS